MADHFNVSTDYYTQVLPDAELLAKLSANNRISTVKPSQRNAMKESIAGRSELSSFSNYEEAYHDFMFDLVKEQVASASLVLNHCPVKKIYVDGGFSRNALYMHLLAASYPNLEVYAASVAQASALGAALAIHSHWTAKHFPDKIIELKRYAAGNSVRM
jgi:glycerol kinase